MFRNAFFALVLAVFGGSASLQACDCYVLKKVTVYECVTVIETRTVPYTQEVVRYDECGRPYTVCVTRYREIQVPVRRTVPVTKWVKVCE